MFLALHLEGFVTRDFLGLIFSILGLYRVGKILARIFLGSFTEVEIFWVLYHLMLSGNF